jgi:periplasmic copper chaperone A
MKRTLIVLLALVVVPVIAQQFTAGKLLIEHPWSRPTMPGIPMGVAYFAVTNRGSTEDVLLSASTPVAANVEMHQTTFSDGMAHMRPLKEIRIAPGQTVKVEPNGIHLMLVDLKQPLVAGTTVPLTLEFRIAGKVTVQLEVGARDAP